MTDNDGNSAQQIHCTLKNAKFAYAKKDQYTVPTRHRSRQVLYSIPVMINHSIAYSVDIVVLCTNSYKVISGLSFFIFIFFLSFTGAGSVLTYNTNSRRRNIYCSFGDGFRYPCTRKCVQTNSKCVSV